MEYYLNASILILGIVYSLLGMVIKYHSANKISSIFLINKEKYINSMFKLFLVTGLTFITIGFILMLNTAAFLFAILFPCIVGVFMISMLNIKSKYGYSKKGRM